MGSAPDWYAVIQTAQYLGVAPWDLLERPMIWTSWARMAQKAENEAKKQKQQSKTRKG